MGKQAGNIRVLGTIEGLCFYQQDGQYYVKRKPQISRKEFIKYKKYKTQRASSSYMIKSARICAALYKCIPKEIKDYKLLCTLQKQAFWRFKEGKQSEEVIDLLVDQLFGEGYLKQREAAEAKGLALQSVNKVVNPKGKRAGQLSGVRIRTAEGIWIRLYHMEELELLNRYADQMQHSDAWLFDFLKKRKQLPFYKDKISRRKRRKSKVVVKESIELRGRNKHALPFNRQSMLFTVDVVGENTNNEIKRMQLSHKHLFNTRTSLKSRKVNSNFLRLGHSNFKSSKVYRGDSS